MTGRQMVIDVEAPSDANFSLDIYVTETGTFVDE